MPHGIPRLWHISDVPLTFGEYIPPGRFGAGVTAEGPTGIYYTREHLFESLRATSSGATVSRFKCAFAFQSHQLAVALAGVKGEPCYEVVPADPNAALSRHDMAWVDLFGEAGNSRQAEIDAIKSYWRGDIAPTTSVGAWEWLSASGLRVVGSA
jgi:hypothetical protein